MTVLPRLKQGLALGLLSKGLFYIRAMRKNIQGPPNLGFMQEKVQEEDFLKETLTRIEKLLLFLVPMNPSNTRKGKLEEARFFDI